MRPELFFLCEIAMFILIDLEIWRHTGIYSKLVSGGPQVSSVIIDQLKRVMTIQMSSEAEILNTNYTK